MNRRSIIALAALAVPVRARAATEALDLHGARVRVDVSRPDAPVAQHLVPWIEKSADAVHAYYGKFPVPELRLRLSIVEGARVRGGQTFPGEVPTIRVRVGADTGAAELMRADWVMVHEMIHLAFPWLDGAHNWMAEGIAVYVESIARVQAGHLAPARIWTDFVTQMPRGLPEAGDLGLDVTPSWGRTYWGGAMFCLLADIGIRRETGNRFGLQHALRAINATRDFRRAWPFVETLELGDRATGRAVLVSLYERMKSTPVETDLAALWRELGIARAGDGVIFAATAPLATIREAITAKFTA